MNANLPDSFTYEAMIPEIALCDPSNSLADHGTPRDVPEGLKPLRVHVPTADDTVKYYALFWFQISVSYKRHDVKGCLILNLRIAPSFSSRDLPFYRLKNPSKTTEKMG